MTLLKKRRNIVFYVLFLTFLQVRNITVYMVNIERKHIFCIKNAVYFNGMKVTEQYKIFLKWT